MGNKNNPDKPECRFLMDFPAHQKKENKNPHQRFCSLFQKIPDVSIKIPVNTP